MVLRSQCEEFFVYLQSDHEWILFGLKSSLFKVLPKISVFLFMYLSSKLLSCVQILKLDLWFLIDPMPLDWISSIKLINGMIVLSPLFIAAFWPPGHWMTYVSQRTSSRLLLVTARTIALASILKGQIWPSCPISMRYLTILSIATLWHFGISSGSVILVWHNGWWPFQ